MEKNKPSATASLILKVLIFASYEETTAKMVSSDTKRLSEQIAQHVLAFPKLFLFLVAKPFFRELVKPIEKILNPGFIRHVVSRKKFIEKLSKDAIHQGYDQIIILGAGYDTLNTRMAVANPSIMCFDIDHPNTQQFKLAAFTAKDIPKNLKFISANLAEQSITSLLQHEPLFNTTRKTLIIIEGVLMYLEAKEVENLFKQLKELFPNGLQCIFTFMDASPQGDIQFKTAHPIVNWWLKQKNEKFLWGIQKEKLPLLMNQLGFNSVIFGKDELMKEYFADHPEPKLAEGEYICLIKN